MNRIKNKFFPKDMNCKNGYTLIELLFYVALFALLSVIVISSLLTMTRSFKEASVNAELAHGNAILERVSREIRKAYDIQSLTSTDLVLNTRNDAGVDKTVEFLLVGANLELLENSVLTGNLNTPNLTVTNLTFTQITTSGGKAVKIFLTIKSLNDASSRAVDFYDTVVLRGIY